MLPRLGQRNRRFRFWRHSFHDEIYIYIYMTNYNELLNKVERLNKVESI